MEATAMAFYREIRVSEDLVCAAATLKDQHCVEMDGDLADGFAAYDLSLRVWPGSITGNQFQDSEQSKQRPEFFPPFSAQDATSRMDLGTIFHCSWLLASNQLDPNQYRVVAFPPARVMPGIGSSACVFGKTIRKIVPLPPLGK